MTQPEPSLAQQIIDAGRELSAAIRARDEDRRAAARSRLAELQEQQAQEVAADAAAV